jgi:hypothetical protein
MTVSSSGGVHYTGVSKVSQKLDQWTKDSIARWELVVSERISATNPMAHYRCGTWCIGYILAADHTELRSDKLLEILRDMPGQTRCIHPWRVPSPDEKKPYPFQGMLECWPEATGEGYSRTFWRASPDLRMFYLQTYDEDEYDEDSQSCLSGTELLVRNPVWRIAECVTHSARLSRALAVSSGIAAVCARWTGLRGRVLAAELSKSPIEKYRCRQDSVESAATVVISDIEAKLPQLVGELLAPLYEAFSFFRLSEQELRSEISKMWEKCAGAG